MCSVREAYKVLNVDSGLLLFSELPLGLPQETDDPEKLRIIVGAASFFGKLGGL